ncbi:MAG: MauE/DoxX family redox-associated membrane protein [Micrococcaceae bacterium]
MSPILYVFVSFVLAGIFLISGLSKIKNRPATLEALYNFKFPESTHSFIATALPLGELILAVALIFASAPLHRIASLVAALLMLIFLVMVTSVFLKKEEFSCNCFGAGSANISEMTVSRNMIFVFLSGLAVWGSFTYPGVIQTMTQLSSTLIVLLPILLALTAGIVGVWYLSNQRQLEAEDRIDELEQKIDTLSAQDTIDSQTYDAEDHMVDDAVKDFSVIKNGKVTTLGELAKDREQLLLFVDPHCLACKSLKPYFPQWQKQLGNDIDFNLLSLAEGDEVKKAYGDFTVLTPDGNPHEVQETLGFEGNPAAAIISTQGDMSAGPILGVDVIKKFMNTMKTSGTENEDSAELQAETTTTAETTSKAPNITLLDPKTVAILGNNEEKPSEV